MSEQETLRLAASVVDNMSPAFRNMQKSFRALTEQMRGAHKEGVTHANEHGRALRELHRSAREVTEHVKGSLEPALAGLGIGALSVAGGIAAVAASVREFGSSARDLNLFTNATNM